MMIEMSSSTVLKTNMDMPDTLFLVSHIILSVHMVCVLGRAVAFGCTDNRGMRMIEKDM